MNRLQRMDEVGPFAPQLFERLQRRLYQDNLISDELVSLEKAWPPSDREQSEHA